MREKMMPRIEQWGDGGGEPTWHVCGPNGVTAAVFHNEQFLRTVLTDVFGLDAFDPIPVAEINREEVAAARSL